MCLECTSTQVFREMGAELFRFPRSDRRRTEWEGGTVDNERPDTTACLQTCAMKHSQNNSPAGSKSPRRSIRFCFSQSFPADPASYPVDQRLARKWFPELLVLSTVRERGFCCGSWLFVDDRSANGHHFFSTYGSLSRQHACNRNLREDYSWKYSTATRKTVQE